MDIRLIDFHVFDSSDEDSSDDSSDGGGDGSKFTIQMFGMDEEGKTYTLFVENFKPFFYVRVRLKWSYADKIGFVNVLKKKVGKNGIHLAKFVLKKKLYGFDAGQKYKFIALQFNNMKAFRKASKMWYKIIPDKNSSWGNRYVLRKEGYKFRGMATHIYESKIPPLLRYFHIQNISPAGWIRANKVKISRQKNTTSDIEGRVKFQNIEPLPHKEDDVPLRICSYDIEASSSHGDFPVPKKTYERLAMDILDFWDNYEIDDAKDILEGIVLTAFGYDTLEDIKKVFPKVQPSEEKVKTLVERWLGKPVSALTENAKYEKSTIQTIFDNETTEHEYGSRWKSKPRKKDTIVDLLENAKFKRADKLEIIDKTLSALFPRLEGDTVTFIGSSFRKNYEKEPYLNHCIVLGDCAPVKGAVIECYETERECLLAWTALIQRENPEIIAGYNICGFDYRFMLERADELYCLDGFLKLSRNKGEICKVKNSSIKIASGVHNLKYVEMPGRIAAFDLYNLFRREYNLSSYKLDNVSSYFISDKVKKYENIDKHTKIYSGDLMGLKEGNYVRFEITGHSSEEYENGKKFEVKEVGVDWFIIDGIATPDKTKYIKWCLAKDDVTPQDIFRLSKGTIYDKAIIAKYCIMDCVLIHHLTIKNDLLTGFKEMANICSIPTSFAVLRGQGIKLLSFIAKKCMEKETLLPDVNKGHMNAWYEGAICLKPKKNLYLDNPVACVDYSSLYPSSMISENISHDSKVWTKEYNLEGTLIKQLGRYDEYDELPDYKYVDIEFNTYKWLRKSATSKEEKVKVGRKICRYAQYPDGKKAIMPSILVELLAARKATRNKIKYKTVTLMDGVEVVGLVAKTDDGYTIIQEDGVKKEVVTADVEKVEDTYNDFMKNVFDKRQQGIKVTANSLYGQCGAKTSTFYEEDIAASTTATGRKLLLYAKRVIEEVYQNRVCETSHGAFVTNADCVYGDTDSCFFTFNLTDLEGNKIRGKKALEITIELAQEAGELASSMLKAPHDLEYEKTFMPWALISKKRYVGMLYEFDPNKCKRKSMGIVLKRRDNAPIVKDIYGGIIDILMKEQDVEKAIEFARKSINDLMDGKYSDKKLIISKSLRSFYKNPRQIAHKVLADRIGKRDPGNKPTTGQRIPFIYIQTKGKKKLQGERIETPAYMKEKGLKPDYMHYITNQILKPVLQLFALPYVLKKIPAFRRKERQFNIKLEYLKQTLTDEKYEKKEGVLRNKEAKMLIFDDCLRRANNMKNKNRVMTSYFQKVSN